MKLTDTQAVILANASQSFDGNVLPLPGSLRGGAQSKVVDSLLKRGLIEESCGALISPMRGRGRVLLKPGPAMIART